MDATGAFAANLNDWTGLGTETWTEITHQALVAKPKQYGDPEHGYSETPE